MDSAAAVPATPGIVFEVAGAECMKCGWKWVPRVWPPKRCPNCNDALWWQGYVYNIKRGGKGGRAPRKTRQEVEVSLRSQRTQHKRKVKLQRQRREAAKRVTQQVRDAAERED